MSTLPVVLTFGLSDATGAAGVQADQLACASMGCHPATVITAIATTGRDDGDDWLAIDADLVDVQAKSVLQNMPVAAFKIGALAAAESGAARGRGAGPFLRCSRRAGSRARPLERRGVAGRGPRRGVVPEEFDLVFAYPWPGEEQVIEDLFERFAGDSALLLTFHGIDGLRLRRKVADTAARR